MCWFEAKFGESVAFVLAVAVDDVPAPAPAIEVFIYSKKIEWSNNLNKSKTNKLAYFSSFLTNKIWFVKFKFLINQINIKLILSDLISNRIFLLNENTNANQTK